jgi:hypothetical protein
VAAWINPSNCTSGGFVIDQRLGGRRGSRFCFVTADRPWIKPSYAGKNQANSDRAD